MKWYWRVFKAPGDDETDLPIKPTSWHYGRTVRMLDGHWKTILRFSVQVHSEKGKMLDMLAQSTDDKTNDSTLSTTELQDMIGFIDSLIHILKMPETSRLVPAKGNPDKFENQHYVDMLTAVQAVISESLRLNQPFRSWFDF